MLLDRSETAKLLNNDVAEDSALKLGLQSFLHSAFQQPYDGLAQLVNHVADKEILPDPKLIAAPAPVKFGSSAWLAETVGSGFGMVLPFLLIKGSSDAVLARAGAMAERVPLGAQFMQTLNMSAAEAATASTFSNAVRFTAPAAKMALNGALYGLVLTPSADPTKNFWEQRGSAAASSAITFGAMGLASRGILATAESKFAIPVSDPSFNASLKGIGFRLGANALGGAVGGFFNAESSSLLSGHGSASTEQVAQSITSFMVTGAALDGAHIGAEYIQSSIAAAREAAQARALYVPPTLSAADQTMLDNIQRAHFQYFQKESDALTGLTKDRSTDSSPSSIAAVGFSLTAHGVAAERGWTTREEAANYTLKVLNTLWSSKQGSQAEGVSGDHGFFYHFLDPKTGNRAGQNELSTIDTALLMSGVLFSKNYFAGNNPKEAQIRTLADQLYQRVDWNWAMNANGRVSMGWTPEHGFIPADWQGYNEAPLLLMLGMGSTSHPLPASAWETYMSTSKMSQPYGQKSIEFGPLFGHQYSQVWLDFRGIKDAVSKENGFTYFENSRRAALNQHQYAIQNPQNWRGYSALDWGLTASDGPADLTKNIDGRPVQFRSYSARGFPNDFDDGTIAPTAAAASLPFAPEIVMPTLRHWINNRPELMGPLGFQDAFNPTFDPSKPSGWVDKETLGIDQGPIMLMAENYRSGFIWQTMSTDPNIKMGLNKGGFTEAAPLKGLSKLIDKIAQRR